MGVDALGRTAVVAVQSGGGDNGGRVCAGLSGMALRTPRASGATQPLRRNGYHHRDAHSAHSPRERSASVVRRSPQRHMPTKSRCGSNSLSCRAVKSSATQFGKRSSQPKISRAPITTAYRLVEVSCSRPAKLPFACEPHQINAPPNTATTHTTIRSRLRSR